MKEKIIVFKDENPRLVDEFNSPKLDSRLRVITYAMAGFLWNNYAKQLLITHIFRTPDEQEAIYGNNNVISVHQVWRGIDFSLRYLLDDELESLIDMVNTTFAYDSSKGIKTIVRHDVGRGDHLHIQVDNNNFTKILKL